jgi:hypothetical protein
MEGGTSFWRTTMTRMAEKGVLACDRAKQPFRYTPPSRGMIIAQAVKQLCDDLNADRGDRAEALAVILGAPQ